MNDNFVDVSALIIEFRAQMDVIHRATSVVESIILKLENVKFVPVPPPILKTASSIKRKTEEELNIEFKKQRMPHQSPPMRTVPATNPISIPRNASDSSVEIMDTTNTNAFTAFNPPTESFSQSVVGDFEFEAVKPLKRIFVSRLPVGISEVTLRRHILTRLPACSDSLVVSMMQSKENANYSSITISVGHNEDAFRAINSRNFWPPGTVVHQYRSNSSHGFRPRKGGNWTRR